MEDAICKLDKVHEGVHSFVRGHLYSVGDTVPDTRAAQVHREHLLGERVIAWTFLR